MFVAQAKHLVIGDQLKIIKHVWLIFGLHATSDLKVAKNVASTRKQLAYASGNEWNFGKQIGFVCVGL